MGTAGLVASPSDPVAAAARDEFLALLPSLEADEDRIAARAAELGFGGGDEALLPAAIGVAGGGAEIGRAAGDIRRRLVEGMEAQAVPVLVGRGAAGLVLLLGLTRARDRERIADLLAELVATAGRRGSGEIVCVGAACRGWLEAGGALGDAIEALPAAGAAEPRPWHDAAVTPTERLLVALRDRRELRRLADLRLRPLLDRDPDRAELLRTLSAYCSHFGRKTATARALHVERQTLYYRLARLEELLDADLDDAETVLSLYLALQVRKGVEEGSAPE
jgi:purine catabolism regulator